MAITIRDIYAPILGYGWENLPIRYNKRQYLDIEDGLVTMPSGVVMGTGTLPNGRLVLLNDRGSVCAQWWSGTDEMAVVDPFDNKVFTVPYTEDLKCNAREMVSAHIDIKKAQPIDLSIMWVDHIAGECGFYAEDISVGENHYTDRLNGSTLLVSCRGLGEFFDNPVVDFTHWLPTSCRTPHSSHGGSMRMCAGHQPMTRQKPECLPA